MSTPTDTEIVNWLEEQALLSHTGVSIDTHKDYEAQAPRKWRFMRKHFLGPFEPDLRKAVASAMKSAPFHP